MLYSAHVSPEKSASITRLLHEWRQGDVKALEEVTALVDRELHRLAGAYMRRERAGHTLQPTALVNEAYLRLVEGDIPWEGRAHFFGIAARIMRQILVDHARKHQALKRGADRRANRSISKVADPAGGRDVDVLALHLALGELADLDPRQAAIVELRYFGGLTEEEVAQVTHLSPATIRREIAAARFWLGHRMQGEGER